jgi:hypothetical protein
VLRPALKRKNGKDETEASIGELKGEAGKTRTSESSYSARECELSPRSTRNSVRWALRLPKGLKVTFDYIFGNVCLNATARWSDSRIEGVVRAKPSDIRFFTPDGPVTAMESLSMRYAMYRKGIKIDGTDGWSAAFKEGK